MQHATLNGFIIAIHTDEQDILTSYGSAVIRYVPDSYVYASAKIDEFGTAYTIPRTGDPEIILDATAQEADDDAMIDEFLSRRGGIAAILKAIFLGLNDGTILIGQNYTNTQIKNFLKSKLGD